MKKMFFSSFLTIIFLNFIFQILYWTLPVLKSLISSDIAFNISMPINIICIAAILYSRDNKRAEAENVLKSHEERLNDLESQIAKIKELNNLKQI